jgi:hypothetical protein
VQRTLLLIAVAFAPHAGCTDGAPGDCFEREACTPTERASINPDGTTHQFVMDSIHWPTRSFDAEQLGFDLDGDPRCEPDNVLGQLLSGVIDLDPNAAVAESIADGRILHLVEVRATSLDNASGVSVRVYIGIDLDGDPSDNFSGTETFEIDEAVLGVALAGEIIDGALSAELGTVPLQLSLPGVDTPRILLLDAAKMKLTFDGDGVSARLGGSLTEQQVYDSLLRVVWTAMTSTIADDCPNGVCIPRSGGETLIDLFDANGDHRLSLREVRDNDLMHSLFAPDLDLYDADGRHSPRCDGVKDSLSVGVSFTAVPAIF